MIGVNGVLLYLAQSVDVVGNQEWNLLILEMMHLIFRGVDPAGLAVVSSSGSKKIAKARDPLVAMREAEKSQRLNMRSRRTHRHSNFGGTFKATLGIDSSGGAFKRRGVMLNHPSADPARALARMQPSRRRQGGRKAADLADSMTALRAMGRSECDATRVRSVNANARLDFVPGLRKALFETMLALVRQGFKPLAQSVFKEIMQKSSKLLDSDTLQFMTLVWSALRFYQAFVADEVKNLKEVRSRRKMRAEMAQQVQFCMTEMRLWEFVTRKTEMYAGLDETKMETNWGHAANAAALLREMLSLLRSERDVALRAAAGHHARVRSLLCSAGQRRSALTR